MLRTLVDQNAGELFWPDCRVATDREVREIKLKTAKV